MASRSYLFVPGDNEKKLIRALDSAADALVLDLEDSVVAGRKHIARELVEGFLREHRAAVSSQLWVRINPLDTREGLLDLVAVVGAGPDGLVLPKSNGPGDVEKLSHYLDVLEVRSDIALGSIRILPVATETAKAFFALGQYAERTLPRLFGLTWGAEDLSSAVGASTNRDADGDWSLTYRMVRSAMLLAAKAAEVEAIDTLHADFKDIEGLRSICRAACAEGFGGKIAIHPAQVDIINECFMPSAAELEYARQVVAAFASASGAGTIALGGKMLDLPHLNQARRILGSVTTAQAIQDDKTT